MKGGASHEVPLLGVGYRGGCQVTIVKDYSARWFDIIGEPQIPG